MATMPNSKPNPAYSIVPIVVQVKINFRCFFPLQSTNHPPPRAGLTLPMPSSGERNPVLWKGLPSSVGGADGYPSSGAAAANGRLQDPAHRLREEGAGTCGPMFPCERSEGNETPMTAAPVCSRQTTAEHHHMPRHQNSGPSAIASNAAVTKPCDKGGVRVKLIAFSGGTHASSRVPRRISRFC